MRRIATSVKLRRAHRQPQSAEGSAPHALLRFTTASSRAFAPRLVRGTLVAMLRLPLALLMLTATLACSKEQPGPAGPAGGEGGERACTQIGCLDGLRLSLDKATPWLPGDYTFAFELDGEPVECKGALPLPSCDVGPSLRCTPDALVQIGESGCALPPAQHGFSDITIERAPKQVSLKISHDDQPLLVGADITPDYKTTQPNGPGCEPTCRSASSAVVLP